MDGQVRERFAVVSAVIAGSVVAVVALGGTALYLDSIEIDDGLEALVFRPVLVVVGVVAGIVGAWWSERIAWPVICGAAAASVIALVFLSSSIRNGSSGPSPVPYVVMSAVLFFPLVTVGAVGGQRAGRLVRRGWHSEIETG